MKLDREKQYDVTSLTCTFVVSKVAIRVVAAVATAFLFHRLQLGDAHDAAAVLDVTVTHKHTHDAATVLDVTVTSIEQPSERHYVIIRTVTSDFRQLC